MQKTNLKSLYLKKNEERRILAGHLWIFSNEIDIQKSPLKNFQLGELVNIKNSTDRFLGIGYVNPKTLLCARLLTKDVNQIIDVHFFKNKIERAELIRKNIFSQPYYRLIFSESDYLPGLIIDRFNDIFVVQITTAGMENLKAFIIAALVEIFQPRGILFRNDSSYRELEGLTKYVEPAYLAENLAGQLPQIVELNENNCKFIAPIASGQKTGWFYDQKYNRKQLYTYVDPNKKPRVLDVFSYIGAWGIQAAKLGAKEVFCVDSSPLALASVQQNATINDLNNIVKTINGDAFEVLPQLINKKELFDIVIIDPPAFIKRQKDLKTGTQAYLRLHKLAMQLIIPGGILISTSCSLHFSRDMLLDTMRQASLNCQKELHIIEQLHQSPDHPIHSAIAETNYLKGFIGLIF